MENEKVGRITNDRVEVEEELKLPWTRTNGAPEKTLTFETQLLYRNHNGTEKKAALVGNIPIDATGK